MLSTTRAQGCWLRMWCCSSPSQGARLCQARPAPRALPSSLQLQSSPCPELWGSWVPLAGALLGFLFLLCELAHSQVGLGPGK